MSQDISGTQTMPIPIEEVWEYLLNVNKIAACVPGFQSLQETGNERWKAVVSAAVGPIKAKFTVDLTRTERQEPELMVLKGHADAPGSAVDVTGEMRLKAISPDTTRMNWSASLDLSGALARLGAQMMRGTVEKQTGEFFECLKKSMQAYYRRW